jgi:hypothetical protein|tara:strand:- start:950 stop:3202 length:2253 start_codon:yes stop_codon:yes gene_type:complete
VANTIQIKRSSTATETPSASDLQVGELAVNTADAKLFTKHTDGTVKELAGGGGSGMPTSGGTFTGNVTFNDDVKAIFGNGSDFQIFHDEDNTFLKESGTGSLLVQTSFMAITKTDGTSNMAKFFNDGQVELYHDADKRLETTSSGATVTGTAIVTDNLQMQGNTYTNFSDWWGSGDNSAFFTPYGYLGSNGSFAVSLFSNGYRNASGGFTSMGINSNSTASGIELMPTGEIKFRTGTPSGTTVPQRMALTDTGLDITGDLTLTSTDAGASENPTLDLFRNSSSPAVNDIIGHITFSGENDASQKTTYAEIETIITDETDGTEDSSVKFNAIRGGSSTTYYQIGFGVNQFHQDVLIESSDDGATGNPTLDLYRNSASPADQDVLGKIEFSGENDADQKVVYAKINADIIDQTDATEDGRLDFGVMAGGTLQNRLTLRGNGVTQFVNKDVEIAAGIVLRFEGATGDANETSLTVVDPTSDRTITLPDASGTVLTTGNSDTPVTTTSSGDADFVLVDDGGTMKKITPSNLGIGGGGGGITVQDEGSALSTTATTLNFTGNGVTASGTGATKTIAVNGNEVLISSGSVSDVSSLDFDNTVITGFEQFRIVLYNVKTTTDFRELRMRLGTSNSADSSNLYQQSIYQYGMRSTNQQVSAAFNNANNSFLYITAPNNDLGTGTGENLYAEILLPNPTSTTDYKHAVVRQSNFGALPAIIGQRISALAYRKVDALNFVSFFMESGNIASATFRLYGIS